MAHIINNCRFEDIVGSIAADRINSEESDEDAKIQGETEDG